MLYSKLPNIGVSTLCTPRYYCARNVLQILFYIYWWAGPASNNSEFHVNTIDISTLDIEVFSEEG